MQVPVRELKANLSKYLRLVQSGRRVVVTSHNTAKASIAPIFQSGQAGVDALLRSGALIWNGKKPKGGKLRPRIAGKSAAERVLEDRR
ncbi:MAG: type II toxin-antitoxin system prevent-host-death family antitoxin [Betaproteobacteria bacterium]|nr:type II toxin-antitoxin system prevent-host-death family antitoxin [Betaproteobacteria bacterium]